MHIIIGKYDGYIRIIGRGFTVYVDSLPNFTSICNVIGVLSASFDDSIKDEDLLKEQIKLCLQSLD